MTRLQIELLGGFSARSHDGQPCVLRTRKAQALLAYLALPPGRFHSRGKLTALLWGETAEAQARQSFRQALAILRRVLGEEDPPGLLTQGESVALNPEAVAVDATRLETALRDGTVAALERAAILYKGDLLDGLGVDEPAFEEWRTVERERLRELALEGLAKLLREQTRHADPAPALRTALRILGLDPLQEAVHRALMHLLVRQGRRAAALQQYQVCVELLRRELGAEPEEETRELYRDILRTAGSAPKGEVTGVTSQAASDVAAAGVRRAGAPLVGREVELERLHGGLARMLDAGAQVILVSGEAGIGKSRLIAAFAEDVAARGVRIVIGRSHETEQVLPLHPWIDALRGDRAGLPTSIRDRLGAAARAELVRVFPELLKSPEEPVTMGAQPAMLFEALAELIGELVSEQPLALILEDLHWADAMSARLLAFLGRRIRDLPVLIVVSMRPEELIDAPVLAQALKELRAEGRIDEIDLRPLSKEQTRTLVRSLHPSTRTRRDVDRIAAETWVVSEGNPFVIVESVRALHDESPTASMRERRLARNVQEFVAARLERLGTLPRHVVAVAAAIGRDCSFALLTRAARIGEREGAEAVEELVRRRILDTVGDHLDFCHDWIRRVAYERILPPQRAALHAAVGNALEELHRDRLDDVAGELGHHYFSAADGRKAIQHLNRFGWLAARRYALDDACRGYDQAMAAVENLPPSERDRAQLDVALRKAFALSIVGRQGEILELLRAHAGHLKRVGDPLLTSEYHFRLGLTQFFLGEHAQSQLAAQEALRVAELSGNAELIGKALHVLSLGAFEGGRPHDGIAQATRAIGMLDHPETQAWLALVYHDLALNSILAGALDAAIDAARKEETIGRDTQWLRAQALGGYVIAWALALRRDDALAVATAQRTLELARDPMLAGLVSGTLGYAHLERGDAPSAVTFLTQAIDQLKQGPLRQGEGRCLAFLSEAYLLAGDASRARETAARALDLSQTDGMTFNIGIAQRAAGRIAYAGGELGAAEEYLSQALETFTGSGAAFEAARTRVDLAALRAKRGDKDAAREHLSAALAVFEVANVPKRSVQARDLAHAWGIALLDD